MQSLWRKERQEEEWMNHKDDERERKGEKRGREIIHKEIKNENETRIKHF
jgi:hypothetical protein